MRRCFLHYYQSLFYDSNIGLLGLASYMEGRRTKEIGIRKVLGASILQMWLMLSKDFLILVLISCLIASPIAYHYLQNWLMKYDYRATISPTVFVLAVAIAILITIFTTSFQAIKAVIANPVKSLRSDWLSFPEINRNAFSAQTSAWVDAQSNSYIARKLTDENGNDIEFVGME